jgi:peptide/nickel transport system substrate-binding protein
MARRLRRRTLLAGAGSAALGVAGLAAGCGDDDDDQAPAGGATATAPQQGTAGSPTPAAAGKRGGTIRVAKASPDTGLDPHIVVTNPIHPAKAYSHLWTYQASTKTVCFDLATAFEQVDPTTLRVSLRQGVKFQADVANGRELTAEDVAYSYTRFPVALTKGSQVNQIQWGWIDKIETPDKYTVVIKQKNPFASNVTALGSSAFAVVAKEVVEANGGDLMKVMNAGSGPYRMVKREPTGTRYERNPDYFVHDPPSPTYVKEGPYIDAWEEPIIPDPATIKAKFIAGELDVLSVVNIDRLVADELGREKGIKVVKGPANGHLVMQFDNFKWTDKRQRQAIWLAIDRDAFIKNLYLGEGLYGGPTASEFAKEGLGLSQEELKKLQPFDPKQAKQIWEASGGPQAFPVIRMVTMQAIPIFATATEFVKRQLEQNLGAKVEVEVVDPATYVARAVAGFAEKAPKPWDLFIAWELSLQTIPDYNALAHYIPVGYGAIFGNLRPDSPKSETAAFAGRMQQLWNAQAQELNAEARKQKVQELVRVIHEEFGPAVPLPVPEFQYAAFRDRVKNYPEKDFMYANAGTGLYRVQNLWLDG